MNFWPYYYIHVCKELRRRARCPEYMREKRAFATFFFIVIFSSFSFISLASNAVKHDLLRIFKTPPCLCQTFMIFLTATRHTSCKSVVRLNLIQVHTFAFFPPIMNTFVSLGFIKYKIKIIDSYRFHQFQRLFIVL